MTDPRAPVFTVTSRSESSRINVIVTLRMLVDLLERSPTAIDGLLVDSQPLVMERDEVTKTRLRVEATFDPRIANAQAPVVDDVEIIRDQLRDPSRLAELLGGLHDYQEGARAQAICLEASQRIPQMVQRIAQLEALLRAARPHVRGSKLHDLIHAAL